MNKKYELTDETIIYNGRKLYRIRALKDFANIKKGDLGGYIESEYNLSQNGNCWIYDNAKVYDHASVFEDAIIYDNAEVSDYTKVYDYAKVFYYAKISGHAVICDNALVCGNALIYGNAEIYGYAVVSGDAQVYDNAEVYGKAQIFNHAIINKNYKITGKVTNKFDDIIEIKNPEGRLVTAILRDGKIYYNIGCQDEISEEVFRWRIKNEDGGLENNPHRKYYYKIIDMVNYYFKDKIETIKKL